MLTIRRLHFVIFDSIWLNGRKDDKRGQQQITLKPITNRLSCIICVRAVWRRWLIPKLSQNYANFGWFRNPSRNQNYQISPFNTGRKTLLCDVLQHDCGHSTEHCVTTLLHVFFKWLRAVQTCAHKKGRTSYNLFYLQKFEYLKNLKTRKCV